MFRSSAMKALHSLDVPLLRNRPAAFSSHFDYGIEAVRPNSASANANSNQHSLNSLGSETSLFPLSLVSNRGLPWLPYRSSVATCPEEDNSGQAAFSMP